MMCDSSGYNLKFEIYTGKLKDTVEMGLGERVVSQFCSSLAGKNHIVVMDNFFTSYPLFLRLKENSISACGTVNQARKHLLKLTDDKLLKRGEFDWSVSNHGISVYKWKDNKCVNLMSNYHNPNDTLSVQRRGKDGTKISVPCPEILPDYNGNMNFVDNFDRLKGDYCIDRKSKKWWPRLFYHFLDCCVINAFIMHKELNMQQLSNKDFRRNIYMDMFSSKLREKIGAEKPFPKPVLSVVERRQHKPFVPANIRLEENKHWARCAKCSTLKKPVRTIWFCITCNVPLCQRKDKPCFDDWHSK
ncbi:piggyBac transposable element-derived protein 4-like [Nilaparvata lugens]|uniref:piggyBac transposable element-derived protein 4-like n=1 Tax=Nilaparvata lugens TaxID=108931 RepID=UPI00193DEBED|nr:piggyBac transposable element-derived protein 4-like [Nilaparvata lugens]